MITFRLLGPFEVRDADGVAMSPPRRKQRELLAFLLVRSGEPVDNDELIEALWDGSPPASARANLHSYVSGLREVLARAAGVSQVRLHSTTGGYQLDLSPDASDVQVFERLVSDGRRAAEAGRPGRAAELLARGLGLWRGSALEGVGPATWLSPFRARLEEARLSAIEDQIDLRLQLGPDPDLVPELAGLSSRHPLRERLVGLYMRVLAGSGRRADALQVYDDATALLQDALGAEPGPELRRLRHRLQVGDLEPVRPVPPLPPAVAMLPPSVADFTGRAAELTRLRRHLGRADDPSVATRVLGVTGMAGVGKTALALHLAHEVAPAFPDGQLYADLRDGAGIAADPGDVLARFLRILGEQRALPSDPAERTALYRSRLAGRRVLVVLDDAVAEDQVRPLIPGSGSCTVLVTSRRRLDGVEGARWVRLAELQPADAVLMLARTSDDDRVDRQPHEAAEVAELCGRLPLALRVAGTRLAARPSWPLSRLVAMLSDEGRRLDALAVGDLDVRASLRRSEEDLDLVARRLLHGLSLVDAAEFPGSLAGEVLAAADAGRSRGTVGVPPADAEDPLESLVDAHVLAMAGTDAAGRVWYRLPDLVRLVARERSERDAASTGGPGARSDEAG